MGKPRSSARAESPQSLPVTDGVIDGPALARAFEGAAEALRQQSDAINAINVFPVPDGDTGTNMSLTMRAAVDEVRLAQSQDVATIAKAAARGALMGAKGNSGVILSQILGGVSAIPDATQQLDAPALADALERARDAAYRVVSAPKEGTILTAISAAATAAGEHRSDTADESLAAIVDATRDAVARTPDLLPVLKEAGVVDSGAQGLYVMLDGMLRALRGDAPAPVEDLGAIDASWLGATQRMHDHEDGASGFCTEFVVNGDALDLDSMRARLREMGDSLLVVGGGDVVRVHVHTHEPDAALAYARSLGAVSHEKVDDMEAQFRALAGKQRTPPTGAVGVAVIAVVAGSGLEALFESMGATVVHGGQTMNPSAGAIRAAIEATDAADVIVLPDNKNIIMAARQAAEGLARNVRVVETRSVPQGVAALVALNSEASLDENAEAMLEAAAAVRTGEVTLAARATKISGLEVREGMPIGIVDGELAVAKDTVDAAVRACVARMVEGRDGALVTLYAGEAASNEDAQALATALRNEFGIDVEVVGGGQPHYPYLIGVE